MKRRIIAVAFALCMCAPLPGFAQSQLWQDLPWRNIGPANMGGRVTDIEAVESNPAILYVGSASGGIFKSVNAGTTWTPIFDRYGTGNIGDIAIYQRNPEIIYVGTGESCVRNSVGWGDGVYKSTDGGKTFVNLGLKDTHHISEVIIHPTNPDIVWVAAQGHLWGHRGERGIYKTTDGGRTWRQLTKGLPNDGKTGASELVIDPGNANVLYAGFWERIRMPHRFLSGGPNGGIFKSTDGGESWTKLSHGLPTGDIGKIGLAVSRSNPRVVMAIVEAEYQPQQRANNQANPEFTDLTKLGSGIYRSEDGGASWQFVNRHNNRPFYYSHIWLDPNNDKRLYVLATDARVSEDGGRTFARELPSMGGDFHALWINPANSDHMYVGNDKGSYVSYDRATTMVLFDNMAIGQFYAVTADNRDPYWLYGGLQDNGNWGGPSNSRDVNGILNDHWFKFHSGDGFHATVDPNDWRTVYTESQGGNLRRLDAVFRQQGKSITPRPATITNFAQLFPGVAMSVQRLPRDQFRFNWSSPIILSPHNSQTIYFGGNYMFKSTDRGDTWTIISPDLSTRDTARANPESGGLTRDVSGAETNATILTISESPVTAGLIWAGTDDGNVQVTRDGGATWTNVRANIKNVPAMTWVSRVESSRFDPATAYVTFDGHRSDDFKPYVFKTADYGKTWTSITANLPANEPVYVIKEDLKNRNLLFVGTEFGVYATIDGGRTWQSMSNNLPRVAVHDLIIHPRENDLIAATHGRSIWIMDDITPLQQVTPQIIASDVHMFENRVATKWRGTSRGATRGHFLFMGRNPLTINQREPSNSPSELQNSASVTFWLKNAPANGKVQLEFSMPDGSQRVVREVNAHQGINRYFWNMQFDAERRIAAGGSGGGEDAPGPPAPRVELPPGVYNVRLLSPAAASTVRVREDPAERTRN
jgi:photosystem II stability/assembly factor-like uncharacterized protein